MTEQLQTDEWLLIIIVIVVMIYSHKKTKNIQDTEVALGNLPFKQH